MLSSSINELKTVSPSFLNHLIEADIRYEQNSIPAGGLEKDYKCFLRGTYGDSFHCENARFRAENDESQHQTR